MPPHRPTLLPSGKMEGGLTRWVTVLELSNIHAPVWLYYLGEHIFVVVRRQTDFFMLTVIASCLWDLIQVICRRHAKQGLKILLVPHFPRKGLVYAFCGILFRTVALQRRIQFQSKTDELFDGMTLHLILNFSQHLFVDCTVGRVVAGAFTCVIKV